MKDLMMLALVLIVVLAVLVLINHIWFRYDLDGVEKSKHEENAPQSSAG
jgi:hypothetical protein